MGQVVSAEKWVQAVLNHAPTTRHLHVLVKAVDDCICLEGTVPTLQDRSRAGSVAMSASPPGLGLDNRLAVEDDITLDNHSSCPRWQEQYRSCAAALVA